MPSADLNRHSVKWPSKVLHLFFYEFRARETGLNRNIITLL